MDSVVTLLQKINVELDKRSEHQEFAACISSMDGNEAFLKNLKGFLGDELFYLAQLTYSSVFVKPVQANTKAIANELIQLIQPLNRVDLTAKLKENLESFQKNNTLTEQQITEISKIIPALNKEDLNKKVQDIVRSYVEVDYVLFAHVVVATISKKFSEQNTDQTDKDKENDKFKLIEKFLKELLKKAESFKRQDIKYIFNYDVYRNDADPWLEENNSQGQKIVSPLIKKTKSRESNDSAARKLFDDFQKNKIKGLTDKISELETAISKLNTEKAALKSTNDIIDSHLKNKTKEVETLTSTYAELQTKIQDVSSTLESINKSLAEKPQESAVLVAKLMDEPQNKDSEDAGKIEQLQEITENISNRFTKIIELIQASLIGQLRAKNAELEKLQAQLAKEQAQKNASAEKLEALQAQLAEEQAKTKKSAEEQKALQAQLAKSYKKPSRYAFFAGLTFSLFVMLTTAVFAGLALLGRNVVEFFKQFTLDVSHKLVLALLLTAGLALVVSSLCFKGTVSSNSKLADLSNSMAPVNNITSSAKV